MRWRVLAPLLAFGVLGGADVARAQTNDFGIGGVLDVPTARSPEEGTFTSTFSFKDVVDIYAISYQALPRLEASFRYSINFDRDPNPVPDSFCDLNFGFCKNQLKDRSFEVKFRIWDESQYIPQVAIGIRDILGTGVYAGEYIAASKQWGPLDLSIGLGWGRLAERDIAKNPLTAIDESFRTRSGDSGLGGTFTFGDYFSGERVGIFGSVRYSIPQWKVDVLASYSSDSYARERGLGVIDSAEPWGVGFEWEALPDITLTASWQQGDSLGIKLSAALDTKTLSTRKRPERFGAATSPPATMRTDLEADDDWWPRIVNDAEASGLLLKRAQEREGGVLALDYRNRTYQLESDAIRRVLALTELYVSPEIKEIILTGDTGDQETHSLRYRRPAPDAPAMRRAAAPIEFLPPQRIDNPTHETLFNYPNGNVSLGLSTRVYLFDPDFPLLYQFSLKARGEVDFGQGWSVNGTWVQNLKSQFDRIRRGSDSQLPPVRTLARDYLQQGKSGIESLALVKRGKLSPSLYYQAYGGILEEMFAGVGGEVLWRPYDMNIALGVNVIGVQQREFDKGFGLRDYKTVTGHASAYWASPFYNLDFALHAGRYLAKDIGATLEVQKRFANGWTVGAFATLTDVPFEVFGEGSFDKGLIFRIPFDLYSPRNTGSGYRAILRSINRDGGRMIENWPGSMWERLRRTQGDWLDATTDRMIPE